MGTFDDIHASSLDQPDAFWLEQAKLIDWMSEADSALDAASLPFARWFPGARLNLCVNAVDRWAASQPDQAALIHVSSECQTERTYTYVELLVEINRWASALRSLGVEQGDRVLIYLPMIPDAVFAMLASVRLGAIHSVVFGGFASRALAARIDDATPRVVIGADAGSRAGRIIPYKPLLDEALRIAEHRPDHVIIIDRGLKDFALGDGQINARDLLDAQKDAQVESVWVNSSHPSYILYTSGTTGHPKGIQRDTGGHAVALAASMKHIFMAKAGDTFFANSDIGWVVGHSYIVYGPLLAGMATVLYEGTPVNPDPGVLWRLVEKYRVRTLFTAPTTLRLLRNAGDSFVTQHDLSALDALFVAGEPLDKPTSHWVASVLPVPIIDNYWQTETGWPIIATCRGLGENRQKHGSPGRPVYGYDVRLVDAETGRSVATGEKGVVAIAQPLPPGTAMTIWNDDARFEETYFKSIPGTDLYSTFDWGIRDADGYIFILGRTDDIINVAGHRLGTREIEEVLGAHPKLAEAAVVGVQDPVRNQVPVAFVVLGPGVNYDDALGKELLDLVTSQIGGIARPAQIHPVAMLPKTRSGKLLRRAIQAICEGKTPGDLSTVEDPAALESVRRAVESSAHAI